jgi:hypothetical protein
VPARPPTATRTAARPSTGPGGVLAEDTRPGARNGRPGDDSSAPPSGSPPGRPRAPGTEDGAGEVVRRAAFSGPPAPVALVGRGASAGGVAAAAPDSPR